MKNLYPILLFCLLLPGCESPGGFFDFTPPEVLGYELDRTVTLEFSEPMDRPKTEDAFRLETAGGTLQGAFGWEGSSMIFEPYIPMEPGSPCTLTVAVTAEDLQGNSLADTYTAWPGRPSDTAPPAVTGHTPGSGAVVPDPRHPVTILFSEPMNPGSIPGGLRVSPDFSCSITWNAGGDSMVLLPLEDLRKGTEYRISLNSGCTDRAFNPLTPEFDFSFKQADTPPPELLSVTTLKSGISLEDLSLTPRNAGIRHDDRFALEFSRPVPPEEARSLVGFGPSRAFSLAPEDDRRLLVLTPEDPLTFGREYTLEIRGRLYNLFCNAAESAPPEVREVHLSTDGTATLPMMLESTITEGSGTVDFFVYIHSPGGISFSSLLKGLCTGTTNGCIDMDIQTVTGIITPPAGLRAPGENEYIYRFSGPVAENPGPGIVTLTIDEDLQSSAGIPMTGKAVFQVLNP